MSKTSQYLIVILFIVIIITTRYKVSYSEEIIAEDTISTVDNNSTANETATEEKKDAKQEKNGSNDLKTNSETLNINLNLVDSNTVGFNRIETNKYQKKINYTLPKDSKIKNTAKLSKNEYD